VEPTTLVLIRHAQPATGPPPGPLCGWLDVPLSAAGWAQLDGLRRRLGRRGPPAALYTSPLRRARQTAGCLSRLWALPARECDALREIHCGVLEGVPIETVRRRHPALWARNLAQQDDAFAWPGGESYRAFRDRVLDAVEAIAGRHRGGAVAIVTHAGVIAQVLGALDGRPAAEWGPFRPDLASVTEVAWDRGAGRLLRFNDSR
jgi:alpha-ribazole phosphatase/probable phosphoglycerate mutase